MHELTRAPFKGKSYRIPSLGILSYMPLSIVLFSVISEFKKLRKSEEDNDLVTWVKEKCISNQFTVWTSRHTTKIRDPEPLQGHIKVTAPEERRSQRSPSTAPQREKTMGHTTTPSTTIANVTRVHIISVSTYSKRNDKNSAPINFESMRKVSKSGVGHGKSTS